MLTVLDTHALVWLDQALSSLGPQATRCADAALGDGLLAVSAISFWEVAMLTEKKRITMALSPAVWRRDLLNRGLIEIPIDGEIGVIAAQLDLHGDPADRIIVATALLNDGMLITADTAVLEWPNALERMDASL
jgi:PIN domain nuclease of toxin-antitoxin system